MSTFEPPPTQGPVRSGLPSGSLGTGRAASAAVILGVPPTLIWPTRCWAWDRTSSSRAIPVIVAPITRAFFTGLLLKAVLDAELHDSRSIILAST